jgi:hypothetical protein
MQLRTGNKPRTGRPRDSQRARVYACGNTPVSTYGSIEHMQILADRVMRSAWWRREVIARNGAPSARVCPGYGHTRARSNVFRLFGVSDAAEIHMPRWSRYEATFAHELAHVATDSVYWKSVACHGPEFAWAWLEIIKLLGGSESRKQLRAEFKQNGVKVTAWKTTPVQKPESALSSTRGAGTSTEHWFTPAISLAKGPSWRAPVSRCLQTTETTCAQTGSE